MVYNFDSYCNKYLYIKYPTQTRCHWPMGYANVYIDPDGNLTPEELERFLDFILI